MNSRGVQVAFSLAASHAVGGALLQRGGRQSNGLGWFEGYLRLQVAFSTCAAACGLLPRAACMYRSPCLRSAALLGLARGVLLLLLLALLWVMDVYVGVGLVQVVR